ncbi:MAG TPA: hypothetical protein VMZ03_03755 [Chitinophagaceae bacterium]|nr:hypothetical protein [Chitinophagaceae bacterium]
MKKLLYTVILAAIITFSFSCKKSGIASNVPSCIRKGIKTEIDNPHSTVGTVNEYLFQGRLVYGFDNNAGGMADGDMEIKDGNCNTVCRVGGFGGPSVNMCNGENFFQAAVLKRNIWTR